MAQLNVLVLNVPLNSLHDSVIFESSFDLCLSELFAEALNQLALNKHQNSTDLPVSDLLDHLDLVSHAFSQIDRRSLVNVLTEDLIIETLRIFTCELIIELTALWLDDVRLAWLSSVAKIVDVPYG